MVAVELVSSVYTTSLSGATPLTRGAKTTYPLLLFDSHHNKYKKISTKDKRQKLRKNKYLLWLIFKNKNKNTTGKLWQRVILYIIGIFLPGKI
jgi:hypothetical protein